MTANVLDNVVAPVTPNVPPTVASDITLNPVPEALLNVKVSENVAAANVVAPVTPNVLDNVVAPKSCISLFSSIFSASAKLPPSCTLNIIDPPDPLPDFNPASNLRSPPEPSVASPE